jgi:hypothetical protein
VPRLARTLAEQVSSWLVEAELAVGVEHAGAELDRGAVAFTDGSQAHHEAGRALGQVALVGMGHHRRVADGGAFDGELLCEIGAHELPAGRRELGRIFDAVGDELEVLLQDREEIGVAVGERGHHLGQRGSCLLVVELEHAVNDRSRPGLAFDETLLTGDE